MSRNLKNSELWSDLWVRSPKRDARLRKSFERVGVGVVVASHIVLCMLSAIWNSPTTNEPKNLHAGLMHWSTCEFSADPGNPPLVNMIAALPALANEPIHAADSLQFTGEAGDRIFGWIAAGRLMCIPWSVLGAYVCFRCARELFGASAGNCALLLWCTCPLVLAYGSLVTADMAATAMGVAALYSFRCWLLNPTMARAAIAGFAIGLAHLTKYIWVFMSPLCGLLWLLWGWLDRERRLRTPLSRDVAHLCAMGVVALYVINLGFGFEGTFQTADTFQFLSRRLESVDRYLSPERESTASWLSKCPIPLPAQYFRGIDAVMIANEQAPAIYLGGEWREGGYWSFYVAGLLVTLPLGLLLLAAVAQGKRALWGL